MGFVEAFKALEYKLDSVRGDWSAATESGVCLALWRSEMRFRQGRSCLDTRSDCDPLETWDRSKNRKRILHLRMALEQFGGAVDVVIVDGNPSAKRCKNAEPWDPKKTERLRVADRFVRTRLRPLFREREPQSYLNVFCFCIFAPTP